MYKARIEETILQRNEFLDGITEKNLPKKIQIKLNLILCIL